MQRRRMALIVLFLVIAAVAGACSGDPRADAGGGTAVEPAGGGEAGGGSGSGAGMSYDRLGDADEGLEAPAAMGRAGFDGAAALPSLGPSVIKTADLTVEVDEGAFRDSVREAIAVAEQHGGYVVTTDVEDRKLGRGSVTIRVPADAFGGALDDLQALGELKSETVSGRDVSQQFVDLQARLRNWQAQESVLLGLMRRSTSVVDTLRVQSHLQQTQLEIEQLKGRLNYLSDQTEMATISVWIAEVGAAPTKPGMLKRSWQRALDLAMSVVSAVIVGAGFVVPVGLIAAIVIGLLLRFRPRIQTNWTRP